MPRVARFQIAAIDELFRQLRFAPRRTRRREMAAAERLVDDIEPGRSYPQDFLTFRITGYRPEQTTDGAMLVGEALRGDLATFVQRLSAGLDLAPQREGRPALRMEEVGRRLGVSRKTLQRYRRHGLVCHLVRWPDGVRRMACYEDALDRFVNRHRAQVDRAAAFTRIDGVVRQEIVDEARRLRAAEGVSLNEAARRLALRYGRSHETIRGTLRRHDRRRRGGAAPIFGEHGPLTARDRRLIDRAWGRGVSITLLARRFGKSPATIRRARHRHRAGLLRAAAPSWIDLAELRRPDAAAVILAGPAVNDRFDALPPVDDALALIEAARRAGGPAAGVEEALVGGYNLLKRRASHALAALPAWPGAAGLDAIETDLRFALRLKARLVGLGLPPAVRRIEQNLHRPLVSSPAAEIVGLLGVGREVLSSVVEGLDPGRGQRLEGVMRLALDVALARAGRTGGGAPRGARGTRASARHEPGSIPLADFLGDLAPWAHLVRLPPRLEARLERIETDRAEAVRARYGLGAGPPITVAALAARRGASIAAVSRLLREAERELRSTA